MNHASEDLDRLVLTLSISVAPDSRQTDFICIYPHDKISPLNFIHSLSIVKSVQRCQWNRKRYYYYGVTEKEGKCPRGKYPEELVQEDVLHSANVMYGTRKKLLDAFFLQMESAILTIRC